MKVLLFAALLMGSVFGYGDAWDALILRHPTHIDHGFDIDSFYQDVSSTSRLLYETLGSRAEIDKVERNGHSLWLVGGANRVRIDFFTYGALKDFLKKLSDGQMVVDVSGCALEIPNTSVLVDQYQLGAFTKSLYEVSYTFHCGILNSWAMTSMHNFEHNGLHIGDYVHTYAGRQAFRLVEKSRLNAHFPIRAHIE